MTPGVDTDNWDPKPSERIYYRSARDGNLGYLVTRDGVDKIRLDRPMEEIVLPFRESEWLQEHEYRPFALSQIAALAFEADKFLCRLLGLHKEAKREWLSLKDLERADWIQNGPDDAGLRRELFAAIYGVLKKVAR